jgi:CubicO group peptidase (beta-lactamase class C family)
MRTRMILAAATLLAVSALLGWLAASGQLVPDVRAQQPADPTLPVEKIDAVVTAEMKRQKIPGVALAIIRKGYGEANVEHHVPVTADTIFQTGSVGKQFTAAASSLRTHSSRGLSSP